MRLSRILVITFVCFFTTACVSSLLIGNQMQSRLMWAFLKPIVGLDPNDVNFFEAPMVKNRMTKLLGDKYEPTMKLLRTAQEIQQEGALFYVISRYAPPKVQAITDKAGMVWNSDTNQMAVVLIKDGAPEIFSEQIENAKQKITPVLPTELKNAYDTAVEKKKELDEMKDKINQLENLPEALQQNLIDAVEQTQLLDDTNSQ
jgi:hypothetical protein